MIPVRSISIAEAACARCGFKLASMPVAPSVPAPPIRIHVCLTNAFASVNNAKQRYFSSIATMYVSSLRNGLLESDDYLRFISSHRSLTAVASCSNGLPFNARYKFIEDSPSSLLPTTSTDDVSPRLVQSKKRKAS